MWTQVHTVGRALMHAGRLSKAFASALAMCERVWGGVTALDQRVCLSRAGPGIPFFWRRQQRSTL